MAQISAEILEIIEKYLAILKENNYHIKRAILFGSYASGTNNEWSDIDLALVSDDFKDNLFDEKLKLKSFKQFVSWDLAPIPYLEDDFNNSLFAKTEILEKGIEIDVN